MRQLTTRVVAAVIAVAVLDAHLSLIAGACPDGRNPVTEVGARIQISQNTLTATENNPLVLSQNTNGTFRFTNAVEPIRSSGFETNVRAGYDIVKLFSKF